MVEDHIIDKLRSRRNARSIVANSALISCSVFVCHEDILIMKMRGSYSYVMKVDVRNNIWPCILWYMYIEKLFVALFIQAACLRDKFNNTSYLVTNRSLENKKYTS